MLAVNISARLSNSLELQLSEANSKEESESERRKDMSIHHETFNSK